MDQKLSVFHLFSELFPEYANDKDRDGGNTGTVCLHCLSVAHAISQSGRLTGWSEQGKAGSCDYSSTRLATKCMTRNKAGEFQQCVPSPEIQAMVSDELAGGIPWETARIDEPVKMCCAGWE
jgi:hypothetical protein